MAISVKHKFVSSIPDAGDSTIVQPSNWNDTHDLTGFGTSATLDAGVANGVATLDGSGTVPISQLPAAVLGALSYQGTWNASTNTPTLTSSVGTKGYYYVVNVAGSTNLNGITDWKVGDWAVYNGTAWQKVDNTDAVTSVNGYTGTVVLTNTDISGFGTMSTQNANNVSITGGFIDNTDIGSDTAATGAFTELYALGIFQAQGQLQSFVPTGTAPFAVSSTTPVANLSIGGNAASATTATTANSATKTSITNNTTSSAVWYPTIVSAISGNLAQTVSSANLSFVPSSGELSAISYTGTWNGDAIAVNKGGTGATTLTGYVKGNGTSALTASSTIPTTALSGTVTNAQLANSAITINGTSTSLGGSISVGTVTSVTGTSPVVSSGGATPAISMPAATSSVNGYLTSTDWTTFNNKGSGTVTSVTATTPITSTGGATPVIAIPVATTSANGYLSSTDWTTFNNKGSGTVTSVAALTLGTTGTDLSSTVATGTTTPVITLQVPTASATNRGALSSTDWTTFNGKANAFTYTTNYIPYGQGTTTPNQNANFTFDGTTQTAPIQRASNGIVVNSKTVSASYSIASGDSAMSVGPITVATGQTVTIASGSRWVVL